MRILLVPSTYLPLVGGVQINTHNLAKELKAMGHDVMVLTSKWQERSLPRYERIEGIPVHRTLFYVFRGSLRSLLAFSVCFPIALARTAWIFLRFRPDIVNIHFLGANSFYVLILRKFFGFPLIVTLHGTVEPPGLGPGSYEIGYTPLEAKIMNWLSLRILKKSAHIIGVSNNLVANVLKLSKLKAERVSLIPVGVNSAEYEESGDAPGEYILAIGRVTREKGLDVLIRSIKLLDGSFQSPSLMIAGDGPERSNLENLVKQLGIQAHVCFLGMVDRPTIVRLLGGCMFLVVPSRQEGLPTVALEAFAASKPVIASRVGGLPEIAEHGVTGFLVDADDPSALAEVIATLLSDPEKAKAMGKKGRALIERQFTWGAIAKRYLCIYEMVLDSRRATETQCPE